MARKGKQPWERRPEESEKNYEAFWCYVSIGTGRTFQEVAKRLSKSRVIIERWARANDWRNRAAAWDASIIEEAHEKAVKDYAAMIERHIKLGQLLQKNAVDGLKDRDLKKASFHSLVTMMNAGVQIEKAARDAVREEAKEKEQLEHGSTSSAMQQLVDSLRAGEPGGISEMGQ